MDIKSLEIKKKTIYDWDDISYINDFDVNSLKVTKRELIIGANIYYTRCALNLDNDTLIASIEDKINPGIKIKDYYKFRFNSDIDLPLNTITEFRSLVINISCVIEKDNEYYPEICLDECLFVKDNPCPTTTLFSKKYKYNIK